MAIYNKHDWLSDQKEAYDKFAEALFAPVQKGLEHKKVAVNQWLVAKQLVLQITNSLIML